MFDIPTSPKQFRRQRHLPKTLRKLSESRLDVMNERLADRHSDKDYLPYIHPTKGYRKTSHRRLRFEQIVFELKTGGIPFFDYVRLVAAGAIRP